MCCKSGNFVASFIFCVVLLPSATEKVEKNANIAVGFKSM